MQNIIKSFINNIICGDIEIYNEFSLQHELGVFLRHNAKIGKIQFERNISHFDFNKQHFQKREIDICVFDIATNKPIMAIELKYPRNGQYPEQMFSFSKDICFIEQLKKAGFVQTFLIIFADDPLFYKGSDNGIYGYFRAEKPLQGIITKPTGEKQETIAINGSYVIKWNTIRDKLKYALVEAQ